MIQSTQLCSILYIQVSMGSRPKRTVRSGKLHAPVDEEKLCVGRQLCHLCACAPYQEAPAGLCREWNHVEAVVMETRQADDLVAAVLN